MTERAVSLSGFITEYPFSGELEIAYTDRTHLPDGCWVDLGKVKVEARTANDSEGPRGDALFTFKPVSRETLRKELEEGFAAIADRGNITESDIDEAARIIRDQLAESALRCALIPPRLVLVSDPGTSVWRRLRKSTYLVMVVDTGALRRGIMSFLTTAMPDLPIWTLVPTFTMIEAQKQSANITSLARKKWRPKNYHALRRRPQASCIAREINNLKAYRPVEFLAAPLELISPALRQNPDSNQAGLGTLQNSLVDRLIIEAVKNLKRERGVERNIYLVTGDKDMASLAQLENIETIYIELPELPPLISSLRYNLLHPNIEKRFTICPVHHFFWDLAHVFSRIQIRGHQRTHELNYYSGVRHGLSHDILGIRES